MTTNKTTYFNLSTYSINRLIKTKLRKPLAALLSLSILFVMSNTCLANQKDVQGANEQQIDALNSQNTKTETDEVHSQLYKMFELLTDWEEFLSVTQEESDVVKKLKLMAAKRESAPEVLKERDKHSLYSEAEQHRKFCDEEAEKLSESEKIALESYYLKIKNKLKEWGLV